MNHTKESDMPYFHRGPSGWTRKSNASEFINGKGNNQFNRNKYTKISIIQQ